MRTFYLITHPNVVVSRDVPVPRWPLSELGKQRMRAGLKQPWVRNVTSVYCSTEQKAIDGAEILAQHLSLGFSRMEELGENDRSATGFLPPDEFERVADQFFASPGTSVRGWERAIDAQSRIVRAVEGIAKIDKTGGAIAIVSHGAVGTLLYCHLAGEPIDRRRDQPPNGGGNFYSFTLSPPTVRSWWRAIDT
ncbi:MAG TPA: histidine phosphatase family protein [Burkholderiales bacterium]|nr:histidine phosphatase family protein [Burkholderiales bacterium]